MKRKIDRSRLLAVGAATLIVAGGGVAYWLLSRGSEVETQAGAKIVPEDAVMTLSVSTNARQWQQLRQYGTPESRQLLGDRLEELSQILSDAGYDYQKDIRPWIADEATIAFLPFPEAKPDDPPLEPGQPQPVVLVLPVANRNAARKLWEREKSADSQAWKERKYKGVTVRERQKDGATYAVLSIGKAIVVTNSSEAAERVIEADRGGDAIASTPGYTDAWESLAPSREFARAYFNIPTAMRVISENSDRPIDPEVLKKVEYQGIATAVSLESSGILFQNISWLKPKSDRVFLLENNATTMPSRLPGNTVAMVSGYNLEQLWQDYLGGAQSNSLSPIDPDWLRRSLSTTVNLDLEKDLLPWMNREFSLAIVQADKDAAKNFPGGIVLMVEAGDRAQANAVLTKLDTAVKDKYRFQIEETKIKDREILKWKSPIPGLEIDRGWLNDNVAFFSVGAPISDTFVPKPSDPLGNTRLFKDAVPLGLQPNNGHFLLDLDRTLNAENFSLLQLPPNQKAFVGAIQSIGVTGAIQDDRSSRYDIFVRLKKVEN
ncbi:MAG TPA: DUF3352 domain-containing protein [Oscillatoriales cyanobacterium M59_W2019_021]|nr:MAG: DUF3352 domain-containing protein [Cyanobacteria bacterium J055]HIK33740.1 DUF3352 domain-containing protein [Oscillatoriales cyanobacterium M4454_W2019_049]HIK52084.1 DUF3352 domain-containing protein [Oscillatoriales cyanobacterium M59_W2019_021]